MDSTIHWINIYPLDSAIILDCLTLIRWIVIYPVGSARYPTFEQPGPKSSQVVICFGSLRLEETAEIQTIFPQQSQ